MVEPAQLLGLAADMAERSAEDPSYAPLSVLAAHAALEAFVNEFGGEEVPSFNFRARFLPKWHDLCQRLLGRQLDSALDLEHLQALRDSVVGFRGEPERLDRRSRTPPPEGPEGEPDPETARWVVAAARRLLAEFHDATGRERPDWL
ncbi:MAG: hypothetical protein HYU54_11055 [Actinobacteria bacterium]|nr:hypothetical protein [Actinomycetota bacterium]